MNIYELKQRTNILSQLLEIWEDSVRATHHFLSDAEVNQIKKYVPQALTGVNISLLQKMKSESQLHSWEHKTTAWKCCSFLQKKEEKESESSY